MWNRCRSGEATRPGRTICRSPTRHRCRPRGRRRPRRWPTGRRRRGAVRPSGRWRRAVDLPRWPSGSARSTPDALGDEPPARRADAGASSSAHRPGDRTGRPVRGGGDRLAAGRGRRRPHVRRRRVGRDRHRTARPMRRPRRRPRRSSRCQTRNRLRPTTSVADRLPAPPPEWVSSTVALHPRVAAIAAPTQLVALRRDGTLYVIDTLDRRDATRSTPGCPGST